MRSHKKSASHSPYTITYYISNYSIKLSKCFDPVSGIPFQLHIRVEDLEQYKFSPKFLVNRIFFCVQEKLPFVIRRLMLNTEIRLRIILFLRYICILVNNYSLSSFRLCLREEKTGTFIFSTSSVVRRTCLQSVLFRNRD